MAASSRVLARRLNAPIRHRWSPGHVIVFGHRAIQRLLKRSIPAVN